MNIFVTDDNPRMCAIALDDRRLIKMVLETAQLVSTAHFYIMGAHLGYKPTHANHPCSVWARASFENLNWLVHHGECLAAEYASRFDRKHASSAVLECAVDRLPDVFKAKRIPIARTEFANCARNESLRLDFTALPVVEAYREYLKRKWALDGMKARWTRHAPPRWYRSQVAERVVRAGEDRVNLNGL